MSHAQNNYISHKPLFCSTCFGVWMCTCDQRSTLVLFPSGHVQFIFFMKEISHWPGTHQVRQAVWPVSSRELPVSSLHTSGIIGVCLPPRPPLCCCCDFKEPRSSGEAASAPNYGVTSSGPSCSSHASWGHHSGPHACKTSTLTTELPPIP